MWLVDQTEMLLVMYPAQIWDYFDTKIDLVYHVNGAELCELAIPQVSFAQTSVA